MLLRLRRSRRVHRDLETRHILRLDLATIRTEDTPVEVLRQVGQALVLAHVLKHALVDEALEHAGERDGAGGEEVVLHGAAGDDGDDAYGVFVAEPSCGVLRGRGAVEAEDEVGAVEAVTGHLAVGDVLVCAVAVGIDIL